MTNRWISTESPFATWVVSGVGDMDRFLAGLAALGAQTRLWDQGRGWVSWFDRSGELVEGWVADVGGLLITLVDDLPRGFAVRAPPVLVTPRTREVRIALHSDRWFPWIFGSADPAADHQRHVDNRVLAERDTPRLNAFLGGVAALAAQEGASFGLDPDDTGRDAARWVQSTGIRLDRPVPEPREAR